MPGILAFLLFACFLIVGLLMAATIVVGLAALAVIGLLVAVGWTIAGKVRGEEFSGKSRVGAARSQVEERVACPRCGLVLEIPPESSGGGTLTCPSCNNSVSVHGTIPSQS